ncbi:MAG TPA: hypothetical protein VI383_07645, partial [Gemmatimonadales bacterium]|nr:hypothetical protein [Gemmatimonadales bacterium]
MTMPRPNYSGRWRFNAEASALQIAIPSALDFTIEHREPFFRLERTLRFGDRTDTFSIDLTVGAEPVPVPRGDATIYPGLPLSAHPGARAAMRSFGLSAIV